MKRKSIAGLIAIAAVAAVIMFSGCIEEETPVSTPISSPIPTPSLSPILSNEDTAFINFCIDAFDGIDEQRDKLIDGMLRKNNVIIRIEAANLETLAEIYIEDLEQFDVSEKMLPSKIMMWGILDETRLGALHTKIGAENLDAEEIKKGGKHFENSTKYMEVATELIENL